ARRLANRPRRPPVPPDRAGRGRPRAHGAGPVPRPGRDPAMVPQQRGGLVPVRALRTEPPGRLRPARDAAVGGDDPRGMGRAGAGPGARVAFLVGRGPEFVYALYGAWRLGAVAVPLNVMLTAEEAGYMLADAGARAVVAEMGFLPTVLAARDRLSGLETVLV